MKILYDYYIFSQQIYGGLPRCFVALVKHLRQLDSKYSFQVFAGLYINEYLEDISNVLGIRVPPIKYTGALRRFIDKKLQDLWINRNRPDVIHLTYYSDFVFRKDITTVITVPDMIHELYPQSFSDNGLTSILKKRCCERADKIIAISNTTKNDLIRLFGIDPQKIQVIYLANPLVGVKHDLERKPVFSNYILYVGERHGYKNFNSLIQAYARSKKIQESFQMVCFGGGAFSPKERRDFSALGIDKNVYQISGNDDLLALYYGNARAFIYPSLYEGFGMPPLEAMSFFCPVICSNRGSIPEIVGDAGIYFNPESPDHIQEVLEKSLFDDILLKDLVHRGKERNKQFSWEKCARETLEVYRALCN